MATNSSNLGWTEEPGRLVHRVAKSWTQLNTCAHTHTQTHTHIFIEVVNFLHRDHVLIFFKLPDIMIFPTVQ